MQSNIKCFNNKYIMNLGSIAKQLEVHHIHAPKLEFKNHACLLNKVPLILAGGHINTIMIVYKYEL